ncbi:Kinesin-like protein [Senna tora]|uniref:Kinesin-like protein n=1 Tax=Senna tora TaxID=362788 RepID=A0A834WGD7_9FABA|nr:Kinesin-like protein [Senna tora]
MSPPSENNNIELRDLDTLSTISSASNFGHLVSVHGEIEARSRLTLIKWLNSILPSLNLPKIIKDEELKACLSDGTVLCQILNKLQPGSVTTVSDSDHSISSNPENIRRFLAAAEDLELFQCESSDPEKGSIKDVVECLLKLRERSLQNSSGDDNISLVSVKSNSLYGNASHISITSGEENRKVSSESKFQRVLRSAGIGNCFYPAPESSGALTYQVGHKLQETHGNKFHEVFPLKHGSYADLPASKVSEMIKSNSIENASTQYLLTVVNGIIDETAERKNGEVPHRVAPLLKKVVQELERRIVTQAEHLRTQNNLFKIRDEKYQSRIRVLEALASGTREENERVASQLKQLMAEKFSVEEKKKGDEDDLTRLMKEKDQLNMELSTLKQELETTKTTCLKLEEEAKGAQGELKQKSKEYEHIFEDLLNKVKELEAFSDSKNQTWNMKKNDLQNAVDFQFNSLQKIKLSWKSVMQDVMKERKFYLEEFNRLGDHLKPLTDAANKYHIVLAENRRLFNEVQELKGNIRVYCRIRPFIPGLREKRSIVEHIGENDLVIANRSKQGKEALRSFRFNKIYGPATSQEEVYSDIQPFIQSVLDGYNACIFAYGQTGSGKTYTMSGPNGATKESYGVNYRALNDLFSIASSRTGSIVYEIGVQMVEIYNEQVRDLELFVLGSDFLDLHTLGILTQSPAEGVAVPDASMFAVKSTSDVLMLMEIGLKNRAIGATAMNERSSRSHSVVSIHVRGKDLQCGSTLHGNLHLVDLAGSERVDRSEATGDRLKEAQHINKSLSALGDVIFALAQKSPHVPYRNSKLTQLLQSSLGGHAKTLMFVQLNPDVNSFSESLSTLKFAERVSGVELGAARSTKEGKDVKELIEQVSSLKDIISKKDEEIEQLQLIRYVKNVNPEKASLRYGSRDSTGGTPKRDHAAPVRRNAQFDDDLRQDNEDFQFSLVSGRHTAQNSPSRAEMFRFASPDYVGGRISDFSDHGLSLETENDDLFDNKVLSEIKKSPSRSVKLKAAPGVAGKSPVRSEILRHASADYGGRLSDFTDRGLSPGTETDDLFHNKVLTENKKSPLRTVKSKVVPKVGRALPKISQPSVTVKKETIKKSPPRGKNTQGTNVASEEEGSRYRRSVLSSMQNKNSNFAPLLTLKYTASVDSQLMVLPPSEVVGLLDEDMLGKISARCEIQTINTHGELAASSSFFITEKPLQKKLDAKNEEEYACSFCHASAGSASR